MGILVSVGIGVDVSVADGVLVVDGWVVATLLPKTHPVNKMSNKIPIMIVLKPFLVFLGILNFLSSAIPPARIREPARRLLPHAL